MPRAIPQPDPEVAPTGKLPLRPEPIAGTRFENQNRHGKVGQSPSKKQAINDKTPGGSTLGVWRSLTGCRIGRMAACLTGIFRPNQPQGLLPHVFAQHLGAGRGLALGVGKGDLADVNVSVGVHRHRMGREIASRAVGVLLAPLGQDASVG